MEQKSYCGQFILKMPRLCFNFVHRINSQTKYLRIGHSREKASIESLRHFCQVDYTSAFVLSAEMVHDGKKWWQLPNITNYPVKIQRKYSFWSMKYFRGRGLGLVLLESLAKVARSQGILTFESERPD